MERKKWPFEASAKSEWHEIARREWESASDVEKKNIISPYYFDRNDLPATLPQLSPSPGGPWVNMPRIAGLTDREANQTALAWLNSGAGGLLLELSDNADPKRLLEGIELPYCTISFLAESRHENFFSQFAADALARGFDPSLIAGAVFWKTPPSSPEKFLRLFNDWKQFRPLGFMSEKEKNPDDQIAGLLAKAVKQLDALPGTDPDAALRAIAFSVSLGTDFFAEIATLKALRLLWHQLVGAYAKGTHIPAFIHAISMPWQADKYPPRGHLLKMTTSAMSAVLGGCDALTLCAEEPGNPAMERVARNISLLLQEESHMADVADPTAGSYYLDSLVDKIARNAWTLFQAAV